MELLTPEAIVTCKKNKVKIINNKSENIRFLSLMSVFLNNVYKIKLHKVYIQKPIPNHGPPIGVPPPYPKSSRYCLKYRFSPK